jgi:hypothetical protein
MEPFRNIFLVGRLTIAFYMWYKALKCPAIVLAGVGLHFEKNVNHFLAGIHPTGIEAAPRSRLKTRFKIKMKARSTADSPVLKKVNEWILVTTFIFF